MGKPTIHGGFSIAMFDDLKNTHQERFKETPGKIVFLGFPI
jgi:hypothetical protein